MQNTVEKQKKTHRKIGGKAQLILAALVLLSLLIGVAAARLNGYSLFAVSGSSMLPAYPPHSVVVVKKTNLSSLKVGDRIVFSSAALGGSHAFHRVVLVTEDGVYTKGDNNNQADNQLVTSSTLVGKEALKITVFASVFEFFGRRIWLIVMPAAALILLFAAVWTARENSKDSVKNPRSSV